MLLHQCVSTFSILCAKKDIQKKEIRKLKKGHPHPFELIKASMENVLLQFY